jgi:hypothetical protein
MIAWSAPSPSRPAPLARRYAALGLDRSASLSLSMVESPPVSGADPLPYSSTRRSGGHASRVASRRLIPGSPRPTPMPGSTRCTGRIESPG